MENTSRGLELTHTEWGNDAERLYQAMETAANTAAVRIQHEIGRQNARGLIAHMRQIPAITEMLNWADGIYFDYGNIPVVLLAVPKYARHIDEYHEDMGPVLWWRDPIEEPPYVGTTLDTNFDETYTWWSPIDTPEIPESETQQ